MKRTEIVFLLVSIFFFSSLFNPAVPAEDYYEKGLTLLRSGNNEQAVQEFKNAIKENPLHTKAYYGLGTLYLLEGKLQVSSFYFNKGISLDKSFNSQALKAEELLVKSLEPHGFSKEELQEKFLNPQDMQYIFRCILYKEIADNIVRNYKLPVKEKAKILFNWTVRNIAQGSGREDFAALPIDIMIRGYGCCDRSAWVLVTLARQLDIRGNVFYLMDPEEKISPHTVALLYIDNKWCIFDTYKEVILRNPKDNSLLGIDEVLRNPSLIKQYYPQNQNFLKAFDEGIFWISGESRGYFPKMKIIERIIQEFVQEPPHIYWDLNEEMDFAVKTFLNLDSPSKVTFGKMFFQAEDKKVKVGLWFYPFRLEQYYFKGGFLTNVEENLPYYFLYKEGRLNYLEGEYKEAIYQFDKLIKISIPENLKEDIYYFQALAYFEGGDKDKAYSLRDKYLERYPEGRWKKRVEKLVSN